MIICLTNMNVLNFADDIDPGCKLGFDNSCPTFVSAFVECETHHIHWLTFLHAEILSFKIIKNIGLHYFPPQSSSSD